MSRTTYKRIQQACRIVAFVAFVSLLLAVRAVAYAHMAQSASDAWLLLSIAFLIAGSTFGGLWRA